MSKKSLKMERVFQISLESNNCHTSRHTGCVFWEGRYHCNQPNSS